MDFYINEYDLAIEVDGKHHGNKKQQSNDRLKNILLSKGKIELMRFDWNNNCKQYFEDIYDKLSCFCEKNEICIIDKDKYLEICKNIEKCTKFYSFNYKLEYENNYNDKFERDMLTKEWKKNIYLSSKINSKNKDLNTEYEQEKRNEIIAINKKIIEEAKKKKEKTNSKYNKNKKIHDKII
jgi:hypothetical protein